MKLTPNARTRAATWLSRVRLDNKEVPLNESTRPGGRRKLDGHQEAYLVALACSDPPEGKNRWSMQMLADMLVELEVVDEIADETVRCKLKEGASSRGLSLVMLPRALDPGR